MIKTSTQEFIKSVSYPINNKISMLARLLSLFGMLLLMPLLNSTVEAQSYNTDSGMYEQTYTSAGSGSITIPTSINQITVEAIGGGGGGGSRSSNGASGGGGGGAYAKGSLTGVSGTYSYIIGNGGASGNNASNTTDGGDSRFYRGTTDFVKAQGGRSVVRNTTNGGAGGATSGTNSIGDTKYAGGNGANGTIDGWPSGTRGGGGGGGAAGTSGAGGNANRATGGTGAFEFGGTGGNGSNSHGNGVAGSVYGGGGSGARRNGGGNLTGGRGANGAMRISFAPAYRAEFISMDIGSHIWEVGETRQISVTVKNTGQATWGNSNPQIRIAVRWGSESTYVYADANSLASGNERTYTFNVTAPMTMQEDYLSFDLLHGTNNWFSNNATTNLIAGNEIYNSESLYIVSSVEKYYSYQPGNWNNPATWTHDPSGTTHICETTPDNNSEVYILMGGRVDLSENVSESNLRINITNGGVLNMNGRRFNSSLLSLSGQGVLRLSSTNFPSISGDNSFLKAEGGTTEYTNSGNFTLPQSQAEYNNLVIATAGTAVATQTNDLTINGNLHIKSGTYRISNNTDIDKYNLTVEGNVEVDANAKIAVGTGKTNTVDSPRSIGGGTAPFLNYYASHTHTVILKGDLINNGEVKFTNLNYPIFNAFPSASGQTGAATVYFQGANNSELICNGTTDFYNLVLDKGQDQTYKLTVYSSDYYNFRLFGANSEGGFGGGDNPNLRKALWIRTGTLELTGRTVIPSLTEGGGDGNNPNSDFFLPANAALVLNGPDVIVIGTADNYSEVNAAYNVNGGTGNVNGVNIGQYASSFSIYGKLQINDGYFSTRESGGVIFWDSASGQFEINGGYVDLKQVRNADGNEGLSSFNQTGGILALRGRLQRNVSYSSPEGLRATGVGTLNSSHSYAGLSGGFGTFNINAPANVFMMSGGTIQVFDAMESGAVEINASENNINVSGGTLELLPIANSNAFNIKSTAPFGNLKINRTGGNSVVNINNHPLVLLNDLEITSGVLNSNNNDVTIGGNFVVANNGRYNSGSNTTLLNGNSKQVILYNGTINNDSNGLNNLVINKDRDEVRLEGSKTLVVRGDFELLKGTLNDNGKTLTILGDVINSGIHKGAGVIELAGTLNQTVGGDGKGVFNNLTLNNNSGGDNPISLTSNIAINGTLTFSRDKGLDISTHNLRMGAAASFAGSVGSGSRYITTAGNAGDGGLTLTYDKVEDKLFPIGVNSYTPATIGFTFAPSSYGTVTINPVNYKHPVTKNDNALSYFWRVKSSGITDYEGKVKHIFTFANSHWGGGNQNNYLPAVYNPQSYTWSQGTSGSVNTSTRTISDWTSPSQSANILDGDYTAGLTGAFAEPTKYYSRGSGSWNSQDTWSTSSHTGGQVGNGVYPGSSDVVIIGNNHTVTVTRTERSASLQIAEGATLNVQTFSSSNFGMVTSHSSGDNGLVRIAAASSSGSTFNFPNGDFTDFNQKLGTTELYSTNSTSGNTYWLPSNIDNYGNLILNPLGGSNIIFGNTDVVIYGDLTAYGTDSRSWYCPTWNSNYPSGHPSARRAKSITIMGDFNLNGGALIYYGNNNLAQDIIIHKDFKIATNAGVQVYSNATNQSIAIGGSLINNSLSASGSANGYRGADFNNIPVTFFGDEDAYITNESGTPYTRFSTVTVDKGNSQSTKLTVDIGGTMNIGTNNWLTLKNGTLEYKRNTNQNFTITTSSPFTIPATAGLWVESSGATSVIIANSNSNTNDLFLNGKLTVVSGTVEIGNTGNYNQDIEYSGGGSSAIEVRGGSLTVNGQVRRNPATTSGVLSYVQTGGTVTINGRNSVSTNAKLEILNAGSRFDMSGGTLNIVRGGGGTSYGDLYLRPEHSTVTGGDIIFSHSDNSAQTYRLDANVPLYNLTITGRTTGGGRDAEVITLISPLVLKGNLTLSNSYSILDMNSEFNIPLTVKGNFANNGTYRHHKNLTTFDGVVQSLTGSSQTSFYDLKVHPVTSFTINRNVTVERDLELTRGNFIVNGNSVEVYRHLTNNATYQSNPTSGGVILTNGSTQHLISGTGTFDRLELDDNLGARTLNNISMRRSFILTNGVLDINKYLFSLGQSAELEGSGFGVGRMITTDGVYSSLGVQKLFPTISSQRTFTYPLGVGSKYAPAVLTVTSNSSAGYIRVNGVNDKHPSSLDPHKVLKYYWEVESTGISGFNGAFELFYDKDDVLQDVGDDADYLASRLLVPTTSWLKVNDQVNNVDKKITFIFTNTSDLNGEYTAGTAESIPDKIPTYITNKSGNWSDASIWTPLYDSPDCPADGPAGSVIIIDENHEVTLDKGYRFAYKTTILGKLKVDKNYYGHNLGSIYGEGTLYLEQSVLPAGRYNNFLDPLGNSTIELGGSDNYLINAALFTELPNLIISGSGSRTLPAVPFTVHKSLIIDGATLDNSDNNQKLILKGTVLRTNGGEFVAGTGSNATVVFSGTSTQNVSGFYGTSAFNNLEINNPNGLVLESDIEVKNQLKLTNGIIYSSSSSMLKITNQLPSNSVIPEGGNINSYVDGIMSKRINSGDSFLFPIGSEGRLGNMLQISATEGGSDDWVVEYVTPNESYANANTPLTYVNSTDKWVINATAGKEARYSVLWNSDSDVTPVITYNGVSDLKLARIGSDNNWQLVDATAVGSDVSGIITSDNRVAIPSTGEIEITSATINSVQAKAKMTPAGLICGENIEIPITITTSDPITLPYKLKYSIDGVEQSEVTFTSLPLTLTTTLSGEYKLISFIHSGGTPGVVDNSVIVVYASPTEANAGPDQSHCGATTATLAGNNPDVGIGIWSIIEGTGGSFADATVRNTIFSGTNGSAYTLRWTISNGECETYDDVRIVFPLLAAQPGEFVAYDNEVCAGEEDVLYRVPLDATVTYNWNYTGSGVTITGNDNIASLSFANNATFGTLQVTATNDCNTSVPREIAITVNPIADVTLEADFTDEVCADNTITFTASPASGTWSSYDFKLNNETVKISDADNYTTTRLVTGDKVYAVATTDKGCVVESNEITINVSTTSGVWTGSVNNDWNEGYNWCSGIVPTDTDPIVVENSTEDLILTGVRKVGSLTVKSGGKAIVESSSNIDISGNLDIQGTGEFILNNNSSENGLSSLKTGGTVSGNTKVRLTLPTNEWYYLSTPMSTPNVSQFGVGDVDGTYAYTYSTGKEWVRESSANAISKAEGMLVYYEDISKSKDEITLEYSGVLNSGEVERVFTSKNYYLFGNPFPVSIDWQSDNWTRDNIYGTIWYRTRLDSEMVFVTYNRDAEEGARAAIYPNVSEWGNEAELALIPPYQSVWIYTKTSSVANPGKIIVGNDQKVHAENGGTLKSSSSGRKADIIRIVSQNDKTRDGAVIYFSENSVDEFDKGDSPKYFNSSTNVPEVYTRVGRDALSINGLEPFEGSYEVPLSVRNRVEGEVELVFDLSYYRSDDVIVLHDAFMDEQINLRRTSTYRYEPLSLGDEHMRFSLLINPAGYNGGGLGNGGDVSTGVEESEVAGISIDRIDDRALITISMELVNNSEGHIFIYDIEGRRVADYTTSSEQQYIDLPEEKGTYIITVLVGGKQATKKVVM